MRVAALEARRLDEELRRGLSALPPRFYASAARLIEVPWQTAVRADAPRPLASRMVGRYMQRLQRARCRAPMVRPCGARAAWRAAAALTLSASGVRGRSGRRTAQGAERLALGATEHRDRIARLFTLAFEERVRPHLSRDSPGCHLA